MPEVPPDPSAGSRVKTREAASPACTAGLVLGLAGLGLAGRERGRRGELGARRRPRPGGGLADRLGDRGRRPAGLGGVGLGGGLVGGDAQDAAPAAAEPHHAPSRRRRGWRGPRRHTWRSWPSFSSPIAAATALATGSVSAVSRMPASSRARIRAAADPASAALAGGAAAAVKSRITIWQVQARSQARSAGRRATWRASIRDSSSAVAADRPGGIGALGGAPAGVRGVRALVDGRAPQGRVALAVGRAGRVGGGRVDGQVVAVDLDLGAGREEAGRGTPARAGGDGHGQVVAAGDRGDLRGHLGGEGQPGGSGAGTGGGGGGGRGRAHHSAPSRAGEGAGARSGGRGRAGRPSCRRSWRGWRRPRRGPRRGRPRPGWPGRCPGRGSW